MEGYLKTVLKLVMLLVVIVSAHQVESTHDIRTADNPKSAQGIVRVPMYNIRRFLPCCNKLNIGCCKT